MATALSRDDVARLHMERRDNPMTITAVVLLDAPLSITSLCDVVRERLLPRPRFCDRVIEHTVFGPTWERDPEFDLRGHVHHVALPSPGDNDALEALVGDLASTALDPRVPLWQLHLIDHVGDGCALVMRVHHVMADGLALVDVLLCLTDEGTSGWVPPSSPSMGSSGPLASLAPLVGLAGLVLSRPEPPTVFSGPHRAHKHLAWSRGLELGALKQMAKAHGTGVTTVLLALVAGALRRAILSRRSVDPSLVVRAMVPLSLRASTDGEQMGNRYASVFVGLPVGVADPVARVAGVARGLKGVRIAGGLSLGRALVRVAGRIGAPLESAGVALLSRRASVVVSNVPGPRGEHHIAGRRLGAVVAFAPVAGAVGLGVTFFGYGPWVSVGVSSGLDAPRLAREVIDGITLEFNALR